MLPRRMKHIFAWWFLIRKIYPAIVVAVPVFSIIRGQEAPFEVEEQAMLDGCNLLQRYACVTSPMVRAGLVGAFEG